MTRPIGAFRNAIHPPPSTIGTTSTFFCKLGSGWNFGDFVALLTPATATLLRMYWA
jgi:hypothetical protein